MARMTQQQAKDAVTAKVAAAGGTITHNQLIEQLEAEGNGNAVEFLLNLVQTQDIRAHVVALPEGTNELRYSTGVQE